MSNEKRCGTCGNTRPSFKNILPAAMRDNQRWVYCKNENYLCSFPVLMANMPCWQPKPAPEKK